MTTHVVHVSSAHPWTDNRIHYRECASLVEAGYTVTLVAVAHDLDAPDVGVRVVTLPREKRLKRMVVGSFRAIRAAWKSGATVIHLHDPELVWAILPLRLAGRTVIYDAHEDLPDQVRSKHYVNRLARPIAVAAAHLVVNAAKVSHRQIAATETIAKRFRPDRVTVVHNYPPLREEETSAIPVRDRPLNVVYIGAIDANRGAVQMIDALASDHFPRKWKLVLAGSISESLLTDLQQRPGWERVDYRGIVPPGDARDILLQARVGMVLFQSTPAHEESLPTKMFEYFAASVPVIGSNFPLWETIIADRAAGSLVDQTNPDDIARAVAEYSSNERLLEAHSGNARRLAVEELNWSSESTKLVRAYAGLSTR